MEHDIRARASTETVERAIARLAERQYGLVSRAQALEVGATRSLIHTRLTTGRWDPMFIGVYRVAGSTPTWQQRLLGACLAAGEEAVASVRAAGLLWRLPGFTREVLEITIPSHARREVTGVLVHRARDLRRADRARVDAIPVTSATRTLIDLAGAAPIDLVEEALDDALRRRLTTVRVVHRRLDEIARRGRPGIAALRALVQARAGSSTSESVFETRLMRAIRRGRMPEPVRQHRVLHRGRFVARVDFAYPDAMLGIEADGYKHHDGRARFDRDRARLNRLALAGWTVLLVTWTQLRDDEDTVIAQIAGLLSARAGRARG